MKKQNNSEIKPRDIWELPHSSEIYVIKSVSNTKIETYTLGDWTQQYKSGDNEYCPATFSIEGWKYFVSKGLKRVGELDKNIKI